MKVLTCCIWTKPEEESILIESAKKYGIPLVVSQKGEPWVGWHRNKVSVFLDWLRGQDCDAVFYVDADDAFFTGPDAVAQAVQQLDASGKPMLIGAETKCWPWPVRYGGSFDGPERCQYPNAGCWIATKGSAVAMLERIIVEQENDDGYEEGGWGRGNCDQQHYAEEAIAGRAAVDVAERLVLNLSYLEEPDYVSLCRVLAKDGRPAVMHGPAPAKEVVQKIWRTVKTWEDAANIGGGGCE